MSQLAYIVLGAIASAGFFSAGQAAQAAQASAIFDAAAKGDLVRVRQLIDGDPAIVDAKNERESPVLLVAVGKNQHGVAALLIERGAKVDARDPNGLTALVLASYRGASDTVRRLLARGASVNDQGNSMKASPLMGAAMGAHADVARMLLDAGATVDVRDGEGLTPLLRAARVGPTAVVELLLAKGASHAATDRDGSAPLLLAAMSGHAEIVRLLLARGADANAANSFGSTPLSVAQREGRSEIAALLEANGARKTSPMSPPEGPYLGQTPPGLEPVRFAPGFVSTERDELNSVFTPDGREFYFTVTKGPWRWSIMVTRLGAAGWSVPEVASFSGRHSDVDLFITPDGKRLFFCSNRPRSGAGEPRSDFDIWVAERAGAGWSEPKNLGAPVNSDQHEFYPSLTRDGLLLFQSHRPDGADADLYFARPEGTSFPRVEKAGPPLSTAAFDGDALISPDGFFVVLSRSPVDGPGDLHVSFRQPGGGWTEPKDLGPEVNTGLNENCPILSPDGKYLFFSRGGDVYWVDARILDRHRPR